VRVWTLGKFWEDVSLVVTAGGPGGERRLITDSNRYSKHFEKIPRNIFYEKPENSDLN